MWSLNQLYVEGRRPELTAAALLAELDRGLADVRHRRAVKMDDLTGQALADGMRAAGYDAVPLMVMVLDREPPEPPPGTAREIGEQEMLPLERRLVERGEIPEHDREVVVAGHAHVRATAPDPRTFAGVSDGVDACMTTLFCRDGVGQPEDVETDPAHRGRGLAGGLAGRPRGPRQRRGSRLHPLPRRHGALRPVRRPRLPRGGPRVDVHSPGAMSRRPPAKSLASRT